MEALAEKYILLDSLSFKLVTTQKETALLAIPETCADKIIPLITLYHSSMFTIGDKLLYTRSYILSMIMYKRISYLSAIWK